MRVVLDTNVLLSAFLWQKGLKPIYQIIRSGKIIPCFTQVTWSEFLHTLSYAKFRKQLLKINITPEEVIKLIASQSYFISSHLQITKIKEDPTDNNFLVCAIISGASFIVSGDKHLLSLKKFRRIIILTPKEFLKKR